MRETPQGTRINLCLKLKIVWLESSLHKKKKFRARVAALEKEVEANKEEKEKEFKVSEIAPALKDAGSAGSSEERNMNIARTILGISARKNWLIGHHSDFELIYVIPRIQAIVASTNSEGAETIGPRILQDQLIPKAKVNLEVSTYGITLLILPTSFL